MAVATLLAACFAFAVGPFGLAVPGAEVSDYATFTQITATSGVLYILVVAAWQGVWAAVFSVVALGLLLLTGRRAIAFAMPLVLYWVDNVVAGVSGLESFRTVSSINPFTVTQAPIWTALVPLLWWGGLVVVLAALVRYRRGDLAALQ